MGPRQVRRELDSTTIVVSVGSTDAHRFDFLKAATLLDNHLQSLDTGVNVCLRCLKTASLDGRCCLDVSASVDNAEDGVCASQIQADDIRLHHLLFVHSLMLFSFVLLIGWAKIMISE